MSLDSTSKDFRNRRAYYRLRYPKAEGPILYYLDKRLEVFEVSEGGARIAVPDSNTYQVGKQIEGNLRFPEDEDGNPGEVMFVAGEILRVHEGVIVVKFSKGITLQLMTSEQIRVRKKYPHLG